MAGKSTHVEIKLRGTDETAKAWSSVAARARNFNKTAGEAAAKAALAVSAATAAAGYAAKRALDAMNRLNDVAQKSGVSASWLQQMTGALGQAGILTNAETLSTSIAKLQAAMVNAEKVKLFQKLGLDVTQFQGLHPEDTFTEFLAAVAACNDEQTRMLLLQRGLEEQGLALAPLLRQGPDAFREALRDVMDMIPAVSDAAVTVATNANNALAVLSQSAATAWNQLIGDFLVSVESQQGPIENVIYSLVAGVMSSAETLGTVITTIVGNFVSAWSAGIAEFGNGVRAMLASIDSRAASLFDSVAGWLAIVEADARDMTWYDTSLGRMANDGQDNPWYAWAGGAIAYPFQYLANLFKDESEAAKNVRKAVEEQIAQDLFDPQSVVDAWNERTGAVMVSLEESLSSVNAKWQRWLETKITGVSAKPSLSSFAVPAIPKPDTEALQNSVKDAVRTGTREGLADGIEASSYEVLKALFRAASAPLAIGRSDTPIAQTASHAFHTQTAAQEDLRRIANGIDTINRRLAAVGII